MDADLIIYIYLRNAFPSHMCWYLHSSVIFRLLDGSNSLLAPAWAVCQLPMASSSSCLRGWLEDFSQHWGGLAEWCAKKMQDIKKRENYQSCKGHESSKWLQRHITYYIQQNSLRWSSRFGMQEHLICALHTIQKFQVKMAHILLQGQQTLLNKFKHRLRHRMWHLQVMLDLDEQKDAGTDHQDWCQKAIDH